MNHFTVDILTPSKVIAKDIPAESLLVPTTEGQINVLEGHTHIVSKLTTGSLEVFGGADDADRFFTVSTGVCKVIGSKVTVLANTSEESVEIDVGRAQESLRNASERLQSSDLDADERQKFERKVERAQLRILLAKENVARK